MAPRILIFSIAMGGDYSLYVKTIEIHRVETHVPAFLTLNILVIPSHEGLVAALGGNSSYFESGVG